MLIPAGRRRRERQVALETLVSRSAEKPSKAPQLDLQGHSLNHTQYDSSATSNTTPSTDSSNMLPELTWPDPNDPLWVPENLDLNTDVSSNDTSRTTPEQAVLELNEFLQTDDVLNATFADDFQIAVPELDLLRAAYQIADRMHSTHLLFDISAESVFLTTDCSSWIATLPRNLQPTIEQLTLPHHPVLDILPWPAVRTKLINMYNLPPDLWPRHPDDGSESSVIRMVYDMEDGGIRVTGPDPSKETSWEIEQRFFNAWWWAMDQSVVRMSNKKRVARGLPKLLGR